MEASARFSEWTSFLQWCASDAIRPILDQNHVPVLASLFAELKKQKSVRVRGYLASSDKLRKKWRVECKTAEYRQLVEGLRAVQEIYNRTVSEANARNRARQADVSVVVWLWPCNCRVARIPDCACCVCARAPWLSSAGGSCSKA